MRHKILGATVILAVMVGTRASACPKGPRESELSLSSVMRNFGRFLLPADSLVTRAHQDAKIATEKELAQAIEGIGTAMSCADAVLHDTKGSLWPTKASSLPPAERDGYLKIFHTHIQEFSERLAAYQAEFSRQQALGQNERDFTTAARLKAEIQDSARNAHDDTK